MFCSNCGVQGRDGATFCAACGSPLNLQAAVAQSPPPETHPGPPIVDNLIDQQGPPVAWGTIKSIASFLYSAVALFGLSFAAYWFFRPHDTRGPWERYADQVNAQVEMPRDPSARLLAEQMRDGTKQMAIENDRNGIPFDPELVRRLSPENPNSVPGNQQQPQKSMNRIGMGVQLVPINAENSGRLALDESAGAYVTSVAPGGPAKNAGIRAGDFIIALDYKDFSGPEGLATFCASKSVGYASTVTVIRMSLDSKPEPFEFQVTLGTIE